MRSSRGKTAAGRTLVVATGSLSDDPTDEYPYNVHAAVGVSTAHGAVPTVTESRCVCCCVESVVECLCGVYPV